MNRFAFVFAGALALHAASVIAAQRTFVASGGRDANPCAQPCRSFSHAMFYTDPRGRNHRARLGRLRPP